MIVLDGEEFLTVEEAARLLGVKRTTLYAYVSRGRLRSYRRGMKRERLYRRAEVEDQLRVAPSGSRGEGRRSHPRRRSLRDIPLAESWIRD